MSLPIDMSKIISNLKSQQKILKTSNCPNSGFVAGALIGSVLGALFIPINIQTLLETEFTEDNILKVWKYLPEDFRIILEK